MLTLRVAIRALAKNKMRAGLTILGVVIGIAAVTTMVSIGQSASRMVQSQFELLGTNVIVVIPGSRRSGGVRRSGMPTLTARDVDAIRAECPSVLAASAMVGTGGQVIYGNTNWSPTEMWGVGLDYLTVRNWPLRYGGFFTDRDVSSASKVCVIGQTLVGEGVLEPKGVNMFGQEQDNIVLMPYTTVRKRLQGSEFDHVHFVMVSARSMQRMADAQNEITQLLLERHRIHPGEPADFEVQNTDEFAKILGLITGTMTMMLSAIAGISLIVGGVGIMNIMLVSVTERTREIGIRMAVGARPRDILRQFLIEAVLLSCIGGLIGFALGVAASTGLTMLINALSSGTDWPVVISVPAGVVAFLFAAAVGIFFGYYPARRASRLDPIESLRYE